MTVVDYNPPTKAGAPWFEDNGSLIGVYEKFMAWLRGLEEPEATALAGSILVGDRPGAEIHQFEQYAEQWANSGTPTK